MASDAEVSEVPPALERLLQVIDELREAVVAGTVISYDLREDASRHDGLLVAVRVVLPPR